MTPPRNKHLEQLFFARTRLSLSSKSSKTVPCREQCVAILKAEADLIGGTRNQFWSSYAVVAALLKKLALRIRIALSSEPQETSSAREKPGVVGGIAGCPAWRSERLLILLRTIIYAA